MSSPHFLESRQEYEQNKNNPNLKVLNTRWKTLTWADHKQIHNECLMTTSKEQDVDYIRFRDKKLKKCLKAWDLTDEKGDPIPINDETIDKLDISVANELLSGYEKVTEVTPAELTVLETAAEAFFEGRKTTAPPPFVVYEFFICQKIKEGFSYVRNLPMPDFVKLLKLCITWEACERKIQAELASLGMGKKKSMMM